jgi:hypothetical protein
VTKLEVFSVAIWRTARPTTRINLIVGFVFIREVWPIVSPFSALLNRPVRCWVFDA